MLKLLLDWCWGVAEECGGVQHALQRMVVRSLIMSVIDVETVGDLVNARVRVLSSCRRTGVVKT